MSMDLNETLKAFESTEANLVKLDQLWSEMERFLSTANSNFHNAEHEKEYESRARSFRLILRTMPKIDGHELEDEVDRYDDVFIAHYQASEVGDFEVIVDQRSVAYRQRRLLDEYRFRFNSKRRELARQSAADLGRRVDALLIRIGESSSGFEPHQTIPSEIWDQLRREIKEIDALVGSSVKRPARWGDLHRHLRYGQKHDLVDIVEHDWPDGTELEKRANFDRGEGASGGWRDGRGLAGA